MSDTHPFLHKLQTATKISTLPLYKEALSLMNAVDSSLQVTLVRYLQSKGIQQTTTAQFGALIELIHQSYNRLSTSHIEAVFFLITHLRPYLQDIGFLMTRLTQIVKIIEKPSAIVRKYSINIIEFLLENALQVRHQVREKEVASSLFQKLMICLYDKESIVRRQAVKSITNILSNGHSNFQKILRDEVNKCYYRKQIYDTELICLLTQGIAVFLQVLPLKLSCQICEVFIQYAAECEDAQILSLLYGAIQTFAEGRHDLVEYYAWIEDQVKELNLQTSVDMVEGGIHKSLAESAFVMAISALISKLAKASKEASFRLLPSALATLSQFLLKGVSTSHVASNSIQSLLELILKEEVYSHIKEQDLVEMSESLALSKIHQLKGVKASQISILDRVALLISYLLEQRFQKVAGQVLKIVRVFAQQVKGPALQKYTPQVLVEGVLLFQYNTRYLWEQTIGSFLKSLGCQTFFQLVPLQLTDHSLFSENYQHLSKSNLLPFIGNYVEGQSLGFFVSYFIPLINKLAGHLKEQGTIQFKKTEVLISQLWALFPKFAKATPTDNLDKSIVPLLRPIDQLVNQNKYGCRDVAFQGLTNLMDLCMKSNSANPAISRSKAGFKNLAKKYIPFLKKLYMAMDTQELSSKKESKSILNCIRAFSAICKGGSVQKTIESELERLLATLDDPKSKLDHEKMARNIEILLAFIQSFAELHSDKSKTLATKIFYFAKAFLQKKEGVLVEKRVYKMIDLLVQSYPVQDFSDFTYIYEEIKNIPLQSVRKNRIKLIGRLILAAQKFSGEVEESERENFVLTLIPELLVGFKDLSSKTRKVTETLLLQISDLARNSKKFTFKLLAGLASTSARMKSATITGICTLVKSQKLEYTESEIKELAEIGLYVFKNAEVKKDKESVRSSLNLLKTVVKLLPQEMNTSLVRFISRTLFHSGYFSTFKEVMRKIFTKLMKLYGIEEIKGVIPNGSEAFISHAYKMIKKEKKQEMMHNLDGAIEFEIKEIKNLKPWAQEDGLDDYRPHRDEELSSDDDDRKGRHTLLFSDQEDLEIPVVGKRRHSQDDDEQPSKRAKDFEREVNNIFNSKLGHFQSHFADQGVRQEKRDSSSHRSKEVSERDVIFDQTQNKFVISENKPSTLVGKRTKTTDEQQEGEQVKDIEQRLANLVLKKKKYKEEQTEQSYPERKSTRKKEGHHIVESGHKFKSKDGKSDALRKGQMEPYAYIRLNPAMMNKRNRHEAVKSFEPVIGGGGGVLKGLKLKKKR